MSFTLTLTPTSGEGNSTYGVEVASVDGWSGTVDLAVSISPAASVGLASSSLTLAPFGTASTGLTVGTVIEDSVITVTASGGGSSVQATINVAASYFTVTLSPKSVIPSMMGATIVVTVTSHRKFAGVVNMTRTIAPSGTASLSSGTVTLAANGTGTITCNVSAVDVDSTLTVTGSYTQGITITDDDTARHPGREARAPARPAAVRGMRLRLRLP